MSLYLLRKRAREYGLRLRAVPGGGWCLVDAARGGVIAGPLDLEHIERDLKNKEAVQSVSSTPGGKMEQQRRLFHLHHNE